MKKEILLKRNCLLTENLRESPHFEYYAARLLNKFGVVVDYPKYLTSAMVESISEFYGESVPSGFYNNPQDTKYFTCDELLLEQLISYFHVECVAGINSQDQKDFERIELFKKVLPNYQEGTEMVIRYYKIVTNAEATPILDEIASNYASYTRPWSLDELNEFEWLYENNYYIEDNLIKCKDNIITLVNKYDNKTFCSQLDYKDVVKLSISINGENKTFKVNEEKKELLKMAVNNCYPCKMTKKQAKYFNTLCKKLFIQKKVSPDSPYKKAIPLIKSGEIVQAASIFSENGSLLERNLIWLLSRAKSYDQVKDIVDLIKTDNPIVLIQLLQSLINSDQASRRTFKFIKNNLKRSHTETDYEYKWKKSILSLEVKDILSNIMDIKIVESYKGMPRIGKIYINEEFKKIALPLNTSASGSGLDVLPVGSRLPILSDNIRAFCYWNNAYDIDLSLILIDQFKNINGFIYFGNCSFKTCEKTILFSGDVRSSNGAEYFDIKIKEFKEKYPNIRYLLLNLNGYNDTLDEGTIYCGYQNKENLNTTVWDPKNIAVKIHVKGKSRNYCGYGIDLKTNEIIILNQISDNDYRIVNDQQYNSIKEYFNKETLERFNMYKVLSYRGEVVEKPEEADIVFDSHYVKSNELEKDQRIIKSYEIEKLVSFIK